MINLRYSKWLRTLNVIKLSKEEDLIAKLFSSGEFLFEDTLAPLYESGKLISEKQLASNILKVMDQVRKKASNHFYEVTGKKPKKNPTGSLQDQKKAKELANSYKTRIEEKIKQYKKDKVDNPKKKAIEDFIQDYKKLAATEPVRIINEEIEQQYKSYNAKKTYNAVLDSRTCLFCRKLNGKEVKTDIPPFHPFCRCFISYKI